MGLNLLFRELQDLCFAAMHPNRYQVLYKAVLAARGNRREVISKIADSVRAALPAAGIEAEVTGREKTLFGIYRKMVDQKNPSRTCWTSTVSESSSTPCPSAIWRWARCTSCIARCPASSGLHRHSQGERLPVAAHHAGRPLRHAGGIPVPHPRHAPCGRGRRGLALAVQGRRPDLNDLQKRTHQWLQSLLDIQSQTGDSGEFLEHVKVDLFPDAVYVFTPRGKIISLPRGATPVDFAYAIHTDIGNQAVAAKVNGEFVPLRTEMSSGDTVEIVTSPASRPNAQWLNYVRTGRAPEIRHYLRTVKYEESVAFGERLLGQAMQELHMPLPATDDPAWQKLARSTGASSREESWPTSAWASAWPPWSRAASRPSTSWSPPPPPRWTS